MKKKYLDIPKGEQAVVVVPAVMARLFGVSAVKQGRNGHISVADISNRLYSLGQVKHPERGTIDVLFESENGNLSQIITENLLPLCTDRNHVGSWS